MRTGRFALLEQFLKDGITHIFGNPGTVEQGFLDSMEGISELKYITCLQESICVAMADGYARKTQKPTVVQLHSGVGLGNGIGMIYQAMRGNAPLVVIAGESGIKYDAMDAQMACDLVAMAKPVTKWATRVVEPSSLLRIIRRAIKIAMTPPMGPVFVALPMDILDAPNEEQVIPTSLISTRTLPQYELLVEVGGLLAKARNPIIVMGDGIAFSGAQKELANLAELIGSEVWGANSSEVNISASNPVFKGLLGHMFGEVSKNIMQKADVILICGTYVFPEVFPVLESPFAKEAKIIHIDLNSYEIAKNFPVDYGMVSDPKLTLNQLAIILEKDMSTEQKSEALKRLSKLKEDKEIEYKQQIAADVVVEDQFPLHMSQFVKVLAKHVKAETIIFDEALTCSPELNRYIPAEKPGHFFQTRGGSLGVGVPGAIGVKLADPEKNVIGFTGDGGSMYTIQALWTAAHFKIGAKFVICNNHSYRLLKYNIMQYWKEIDVEEHEFPASFSLNNPEIDFSKLSESMGVPAVKVERPEDIEPAIIKMLETKGPFLIDLVVSDEVIGYKHACKCGQ